MDWWLIFVLFEYLRIHFVILSICNKLNCKNSDLTCGAPKIKPSSDFQTPNLVCDGDFICPIRVRIESKLGSNSWRTDIRLSVAIITYVFQWLISSDIRHKTTSILHNFLSIRKNVPLLLIDIIFSLIRRGRRDRLWRFIHSSPYRSTSHYENDDPYYPLTSESNKSSFVRCRNCKYDCRFTTFTDKQYKEAAVA